MILRSIFIVSFYLLSLCSFATVVQDTLHINRDTVSQGGNLIHYCCFNNTDSFQLVNFPIEVGVNDTLYITVINHDSLSHTFTVQSIIETGNTVLAQDTTTFSMSFSNEGTYRYYSDVPYGKYLGASGNILVGYSNYAHFFWSFSEAKVSTSDSIAKGFASNLPNYYKPEVFTINNLYYPNTTSDTLGFVTGNVNDSIVISIVNSGSMIQPIHFHGFHIKILESKQNPAIVSWEKDTFPVYVNEAMTILLVPDKPGLYPVHNHNLTTVTTGGYPGGMLTLLNILP